LKKAAKKTEEKKDKFGDGDAMTAKLFIEENWDSFCSWSLSNGIFPGETDEEIEAECDKFIERMEEFINA